MIEPAALLAWSALALIVTLSPGPDTLLVAAHGARGGARAGMAAVLGIVTGAAWYGSLIAFGALSVLVAVPALFLAVKIAGALYLAWLGAGMIWRAIKSSPARGGGVERSETEGENLTAARTGPLSHAARDSSPVNGGAREAYAQGFFTNALNPKVALFYLAALPQFASGPNAPMIGVLLLAIHTVFGFAWLSFIALAASKARTMAWNKTLVRWLEGAVGVFFVGVAGRLALAQR